MDLSGEVRAIETPKHGDKEKTETGETRAWTAINHAAEEVARRAGCVDKRNSCHFLINGLCQRLAGLLLRTVRVRLQVRERDRKRQDDSNRRQQCFMIPLGSMLTYTTTSLSIPD